MFNELLARIAAGASSLASTTGAVLLNVTAISADSETPEQVNGVPILGALGILGRPRAPDADGTGAKGLAARIGDSLAPFALADARISKARGALATGALSLAGYLGQHVTLEDGANTTSPKITIACGTLKIVLDMSPGVQRNVITGETRVTTTQGGEGAAIPVLVAPNPGTITTLVNNMNLLVPLAAGLGVTLTPITSTVSTSDALKATLL